MPLETESSRDLVEVARKVAAREGLPEPRTASVGGASDANFTAALGVPRSTASARSGAAHTPTTSRSRLSSLEDRVRMVVGVIEDLVSSNQHH